MNCKRVQSDIALWVGGDLDPASIAAVERHVGECCECRRLLHQMQRMMLLLEENPSDDADDSADSGLQDSIWLDLKNRLPQTPPAGGQFNGWLPALAVAAVCCAMVMIARLPQSNDFIAGDRGLDPPGRGPIETLRVAEPMVPRFGMPSPFDEGFPRRDAGFSPFRSEYRPLIPPGNREPTARSFSRFVEGPNDFAPRATQ